MKDASTEVDDYNDKQFVLTPFHLRLEQTDFVILTSKFHFCSLQTGLKFAKLF